MTTIRLLCSAAFSIAALSLPAMAQGRGQGRGQGQDQGQDRGQGQRSQRVETICNDGTVMTTADANACSRHAGVRSVTNGNNRRTDQMRNGKMLPMGGNAGQTRRGDVMQNQGGTTTAQMMAQLHIDHTRNNATARCQDGFYYHGQHNRSACSHDGGVSAWYK